MRILKKIYQKTRHMLEMIRFSHTVFALPFALIALLTALASLPSGYLLLKVLAAMVFARSAAMTFNRILDLPFDRFNPRTKTRHLVTGTISLPLAWFFFAVTTLGFVVSARSINALAGLLSWPVLAILFFYSFTKRFTAYSHVVLGFCLSLAPLGAWVAATGEVSWRAFPLALAVLLWVAGFDIIYATQDEAYDRQATLHSAVVRFGKTRALYLARTFHMLVVPALVLYGRLNPILGVYFYGAIAFIAALLLYEHRLVTPESDLRRLNDAFFVVNGVIAVVLLLATCLDLAHKGRFVIL